MPYNNNLLTFHLQSELNARASRNLSDGIPFSNFLLLCVNGLNGQLLILAIEVSGLGKSSIPRFCGNVPLPSSLSAVTINCLLWEASLARQRLNKERGKDSEQNLLDRLQMVQF